ncbi:MAG: toprim domain-containing protein [Deltaproteobacteria bacterium]
MKKDIDSESTTYCTETKKTHILDYLEQNGHQPVKVKYGSAWFQSPTRSEKTPSFKVDLNKNLWYDFGTGEGGNLIDLVLKLSNCTVPEALAHIGSNSYSAGEHRFEPLDDSGRIKIDRIQPLANPALLQYLRSRKILMPFARRILKEAYYTVHGKQYFALAFANDKGGYELRSAYFKTGSSPKYFTTLRGKDDSKLNVFEGFMDYLSCCTFYRQVPSFRTIILNSLSFLPKIEAELVGTYEVNLLLDNDQAGRTATQNLMTTYKHIQDWAPILYPDHKDFNEFLMNRRIQ